MDQGSKIQTTNKVIRPNPTRNRDAKKVMMSCWPSLRAATMSGINSDSEYIGLRDKLLARFRNTHRGCTNKRCWEQRWTMLVNWYLEKLQWGKYYTREEMLEMMDGRYSLATRKNGVQSLVETLSRTPLGERMKLGKVHRKGKKVVGREKME